MDVDDDRHLALLRDLVQKLHDFDRGLGVQRGGGFVRQDQAGLLHQGPGNAHPLPLAARQGVRPARGKVLRQPDRIDQIEGPRNVFSGKLAQQGPPYRQGAELAAQHVFNHRQAFNQVVFLKDHADVAAGFTQGLALQLRQVDPLEEDLPGGRVNQAVDATNQRGLAGARRADDRRHAGGINVQIDVQQNRLTSAVFLAQMLNGKQGGCLCVHAQGFFCAASLAAASASRLASAS